MKKLIWKLKFAFTMWDESDLGWFKCYEYAGISYADWYGEDPFDACFEEMDNWSD
tara:strand:+ start:1127 stop:1291 length:165 start_codon:yes stop_codon:yes gene_type:complete